MKLELVVKIGGNKEFTICDLDAARDEEVAGLLRDMLQHSYTNDGRIVISESGNEVEGDQLNCDDLVVKDNWVYIPTQKLKDMINNMCVNSGNSVSETLAQFYEDLDGLIAEKLMLKESFSSSFREVTEPIFDINPLWSVVDGKVIKGTGESYCNITYA